MGDPPGPEVRQAASATHWLPALEDLDLETQIPPTKSVEAEGFDPWLAAEHPENVPDGLVDELHKALTQVGPPAFLRTDQLSRKHRGLDAVKAQTRDDIREIVSSLCEKHCALPVFPMPEAFLVREWIDLDAAFTAFGGLPIAPEYRLFAGPCPDGEVRVVCGHRYWPKNAMQWPITEADPETGEVTRDEPDDWEQAWERMWDQTTFADYLRMIRDACKAAAASQHKHAQTWSVDFALAETGDWYLIDMAPAASSWHPDDCRNHEQLRNDSAVPEEVPVRA